MKKKYTIEELNELLQRPDALVVHASTLTINHIGTLYHIIMMESGEKREEYFIFAGIDTNKKEFVIQSL